MTTFLRARTLPPGPYRDDLRQLAYGLRRLYRLGMKANVEIVIQPTRRDGITTTEQQIRDSSLPDECVCD